jgi:hypothetical protein
MSSSDHLMTTAQTNKAKLKQIFVAHFCERVESFKTFLVHNAQRRAYSTLGI